MTQFLHYLNEALDFFREGFFHVNATLGGSYEGGEYKDTRYKVWRGQINIFFCIAYVFSEVMINIAAAELW